MTDLRRAEVQNLNTVKSFIRDAFITAFILIAFFFISLGIYIVFDTQELIPPLFILAVFLVSMLTSGYGYGIAAALISVLTVNFEFMSPYREFDFTVHENIISAIILLLVTIPTSALTTKIKRQEEVRLQAEKEKMRADLLRAISHDLRTPLTAIYGSASTVIENYAAISDEQKIDILGGIQKDAKWLIRMVENLLSITKIDNKSVKLLKNSVVLEELIDSVLAKFKKSYPEQRVELSMPDEFIAVSADALLIEQVLLNLLENAVQHAEGMTELKLNIFVADSKAVFEVIDNGCGIEKEKLKNIFSGYYTSDDSPLDNKKHCMGIGLSVCAAIIKAHGGDIRAENNEKGGMIFRFTLELEEAADE